MWLDGGVVVVMKEGVFEWGQQKIISQNFENNFLNGKTGEQKKVLFLFLNQKVLTKQSNFDGRGGG